MWLIFAVLSLLNYAAADLFGKKCINEGNSVVPLELTVSVSVVSFFVSIIIYIFGLGESGMAPWQILWLNPLIIINVICFFLQWMLYLLSMKYITLSIAEAISGSVGVFYFIGLIFFNLFLGKFPAVREMLHPMRLIPIVLVLIFIVLYSNVEQISRKKTEADVADFKKNRNKFHIGLILLLSSLIFDSLDSLTVTLIIDDGAIGTMDCLMACYFAVFFPIVACYIFICLKTKKWFIPLKNTNRFAKFYCVTALVSSVLYIKASYYDAVRTGILFLSYPIVPIIGAKMFLKEKHTRRQNLCIWIIVLAAIAFSVSDYLV